MRAVKRPIEIEFFPCEYKYRDHILNWSTQKRPIVITSENGVITDCEITTLEGIHKATNLDVVIKGIDGECYPCKKTIFEKTYNIIG